MKKLIILSLCAIALNACGFKLRGSNNLPIELSHIQLQGHKQSALLNRAIKDRLLAQDVKVLSGVSTDYPLLWIKGDSLDRRLLSLFASGQVAEYELIYRVDYQLQMPGKAPRDLNIEVLREYQDDPDAVLAKSRELDLILAEMRSQVAERMLRQLAQQ